MLLEAPSPARSAIMRAIRSTGTKPEESMVAALSGAGLEFARNDRSLPGSPDFALHAPRIAVFVDGAFWHGKRGVPKTNPAFWREKFRRNRARDRRADLALRGMGWRVLRISERTALDRADRTAAAVAWLAGARRERRVA